ncbi:MAG: ATPase domain-containing protein [Gemmatimonadaceae bacterium]
MSIAVLRQRIAEILEPHSAGVPHLPTGLSELDAVLQAQGIPRGRVTEITGALGGGKTTLLRQIVNTTAARSEWVAYVDATRTLAPRDWAVGGGGGGAAAHTANLFVARPKTLTRAAWCTDILLRSGAFALVVLDGAPPLSRSVFMRLTRLARDSGAALVVVATDQAQPAMLGGALKLRVERSRRGKRLTITVERGGKGGGGTRRTIEVSYAIKLQSRLRTHPEAPDRRGAARTKTGCGVSGVGCGDTIRPVARVLPKKKRFADPPFPTPRRHTSATRVSSPMRSA